MTKQADLYVAIFVTVSLALGWYGRSLRGAHHELMSTSKKIAGLRKSRDHYLGIIAFVTVVCAVMLYVLATKHR